ncbi:hypothetical protein GCM10012320_34280 [Sinomonas cellulolyticus]|nr:hypothetical protein GCM10012320_34280 [Sinomonas sp. KCTC 49339]
MEQIAAGVGVTRPTIYRYLSEQPGKVGRRARGLGWADRARRANPRGVVPRLCFASLPVTLKVEAGRVNARPLRALGPELFQSKTLGPSFQSVNYRERGKNGHPSG